MISPLRITSPVPMHLCLDKILTLFCSDLLAPNNEHDSFPLFLFFSQFLFPIYQFLSEAPSPHTL